MLLKRVVKEHEARLELLVTLKQELDHLGEASGQLGLPQIQQWVAV